MANLDVERRFAAILAADVVKYSVHMADNEERTLQRFGESRAIFSDIVGKHRGRLFGEAGDALLAEFASPVEAIRAAIEIQQALEKKNQDQVDLQPFQFRIGVNLGDVMVDGDNLYGEGVNLAARIEGLSDPGGVALSSNVHTYIRNKVDFDFEDQGLQSVKNADEPVHVYKVRLSEPTATKAEQAPMSSTPTMDTAGAKPRLAVPPRRRPPSRRPMRKSPAELASVMDAATGFMQRSTDIEHDGDRLPWLLFLGGADAGIGDLLETAAADAPFTPPEQPNPSETFHWSWWFLRGLIAIETSQSFVEGPGEDHRLDGWSNALSALKTNRPAMPITGFVLCVPQHILLDETARRDQAYALRRLLDKAATMLGVTVPVYLLITRLDDIAGFASFKASLPQGIERQVIGHLVEDQDQFSGDKAVQEAAVKPIFDRFSSLRLGMLRHEVQIERKRGIFDFVRGFNALSNGVSAMIDLLTAPTELQHDVRLRGIFWVANGATPAFYQDLFSRFLPQDHPLPFQWTGVDLADLQASDQKMT